MKNLFVFLLCILAVQVVAQKGTTLDWRKMGGNKDVTFYEVQQDFYDYWSDKTPSKGQGYSVFKRWEAYMLPRVYPTGDMTLASTTYGNYMEWLKGTGSAATARSATSNFTTLGPLSVPSGYDSGAGRVDFLRFDPTNSNTMFVGTPDGGLWKSTNGGTTWTTNTDMLGVIGCSDLVIDSSNTQNMYLATGNWETDRRSIGILKSTNGGTSWSATSLTWTATDNYKIRRLIMDPTNPLVMMAATDGGVFRTTDGWATNTNVSTIGGDYNLYDIKFKPGNSNTVYASGTATNIGTDVFWKSTDNGATWTAVSSGLPSSSDVSRIIIGVTAHDTAYVYLLAGNAAYGYKGLYRSTDSGASFSTQSTTPNVLQSSKTGSGTGGQANHDLAIAVDPGNKNKVTIGGINQWRSTDGGVSWTIYTYWLGNDPDYPGEGDATPEYTHADIQDIQYLPGSSTTLFTTADGGVYKTINDGTNFTKLANNLSIAQQTNVALSATTEGILVTGLQDIGTIKREAAGTWSVINGGDGEAAFIDRTNDLVIITSCPNGEYAISLDGGPTRNSITGLPAGTLFFSPISQDPVSASVCYAGGRPSLYKNVDFVNNPNTWVTLGSPPSTGSGASIIRFVVAPNNNNIIYVIKGNESDATTLSKSTDGGSTFTDITGTLPTTVQMSNLTVSNVDSNKVWITYSGYEATNKVFRSTDGGTNWENMSGGLPNIPMNTIVHVNDSANDALYLGADIGVYYYDNTVGVAPGNWTSFSTNLPNSRVTDLKIFYPTSKLRVATYGRGTWESSIATALPVELSNFFGKNKGKTNLLSWTTDSERNLDYYAIERSINGDDYETIGSVSPEYPNSVAQKSYRFSDSDPLKGINYYRLKIVDIDSKFEYSKVVALFVEDKESAISLYPNPTDNILEIKGLQSNNVNIQLMDASGKFLRSQKLLGDTQINVRDLPNGIYYIEIVIGNEKSVVKRFIKG